MASRMWHHHVWFSLLLALFFGTLFVAAIVPTDSVLRRGPVVLAAGIGLGLAYTSIGSLVGYYVEARELPGDGWQPRWPLWMLGHVLLTPVVTAPLYVLWRWWRFGLDPSWRDHVPLQYVWPPPGA